MMNSVDEQALFEEAALVLEDGSPPESLTHPAVAGKTPTTDDHQADLATTVDGTQGLYALKVCLARGYMSFPPVHGVQ